MDDGGMRLCPLEDGIAALLGNTERPLLVQLGPGPTSLRQAILEGRAAGLILENGLPDLPLGEQLYRADLGQVDLLWVGEPGMWDVAREALHHRAVRPRLVLLSPQTATQAIKAAWAAWGYAVSVSAAGLLARREGPPGISGTDHAALLAMPDSLPLLRLLCALAPREPEGRRRLIQALTAEGALLEAMAQLADWSGDPAAMGEAAGLAASATLARFNQLLAAEDIGAAERYASALAALYPANAAFLEAALACNRRLGHAARVGRSARHLLARDPHHLAAHMALLEHEPADELASRACLALAPEGPLHPLRRLHEAHRAVSLLLLRPLDAAGRQLLGQLVAAARRIEPEALEDAGQRQWARHYRLLVEAAQPSAAGEVRPFGMTPPITASGARLGWAKLRQRAAKLVFVVAADEAYLRLYGRPYLTSILRHCDLPALILVHVIGGRHRLADLVLCVDIDDPRLVFTADDLAIPAITTRCHDSDGPRALPVAHLQCVRFAAAERVLAQLRRPVIVSDIDVILQRGVSDLLECFGGSDVVLNRNEASASFGSHITANLALFFPTPATARFLSDLRRHLDAHLAMPDVTRWIDQCGLHLCWNAHESAGGTRFGWFDTAADINNVMYRRYEANPFRFLSLFHGFDMASLPAA